jgi:hypothetical protein
MKLSILSILLTMAAMTSIAHADVSIDFNTHKGTVETWHKNGGILSSTDTCTHIDQTYTDCTAE